MTTYRFKQDYAGRKKGETFTDKQTTKGDHGGQVYRWVDVFNFAAIEIPVESPLIEAVQGESAPLIVSKTNEDMVYYNAKTPGIKSGDSYWMVHQIMPTIVVKAVANSKTAEEFESKSFPGSVRFATEKAANDFVRLAKAATDAKLTHKKEIPAGIEVRRATLINGQGEFQKVVLQPQELRKIDHGYIYQDIPCTMIQGSGGFPIFIPIEDIVAAKKPAPATSTFIVTPEEGPAFKVTVGKGVLVADLGTSKANISADLLKNAIADISKSAFEVTKVNYLGRKGIPVATLKNIYNQYTEMNK